MSDDGNIRVLLLREQLTLAEAVLIIQHKIGGSFEAAAKLLVENVEDFRLSAKRRPMVHPGARIRPPIDLNESSVERGNLLAWLEQFLSLTDDRQTINHPTTSHSRWPWGNYETELLRKLAAAAERFWAKYDPTDPTTAPTNQQLIDWLKQQGMTDRTASAMATILRADGLPPGPRSSS